MDLIVHTLSSYPNADVNLKMDVGIKDCLHKEFEYNKSRYQLQDVIVGKIYFVLFRIKIKHMEITIIKSETVGFRPNAAKETDPVANFEIMDGAPVRGDRPFQNGATLWRKADKPVRKISEPATVDGSTNGLEDTVKANVAEDHANGRDMTAYDEQ